jgi:hypothetical protein
MKTTLTIEGELEELRFAIQEPRSREVIRVLMEEMRQAYKYGSDDVRAAHARSWRDRLYELLHEAGIDIDG